MDNQWIGAACRALRRRLGWRQVDLAERVGCHQTTISRIERGALKGVPLDLLERVFGALGARFSPDVWWRSGELDRVLDEDHAAAVEAAASVYRVAAWLTLPEVTFNHYGDRGSIDLLCAHPEARSIAVNEMQTRLLSMEELHRRHDVKVRLAAAIAEERFGWRPRWIGRILVVPEDSTIRRVVEHHGATLGAAYPARCREVSRWIRQPAGPRAGIWFLSPKRGVIARSGRPAGRRTNRGRDDGR